MAITDNHPEYDENKADWKLVSDALSERKIKSANEVYLPRTGGQAQWKKDQGNDLAYETYKQLARFPLLVNPAVTALTGIAHRAPAEITVPDRLLPLLEHITTNAEPLEELSRKTVRHGLLHGRYGLLSDVDKQGNPYIATYDANSITHWKTSVIGGREILTMVKLKEQINNAEDEYGTNLKDVYRVLRLEDGVYTSRLYDDQNVEMPSDQVLTAAKKGLSEIPFVLVGSVDLTPSIDESPMLALAKAAVNIYQLDADYRQSLHMTAEATPVITGVGNGDEGAPTTIGSTTIWYLPNEHAKASYLEVSGNGIEAIRQAISDEFQRASKIAGELSSDSSKIEAAEALRIRMFARHATLQSVATSAGAGIEKALRYCAELIAAKPEDVSYKPNTDFSGAEVSDAMFKTINDSVNAANLPQEVLFELARKAKLTELEDDELFSLIEQSGLATANGLK